MKKDKSRDYFRQLHSFITPFQLLTTYYRIEYLIAIRLDARTIRRSTSSELPDVGIMIINSLRLIAIEAIRVCEYSKL